jgi:hypothetical protein
MIVADGTLEAYQAYDALFSKSQFAPEVREWIVRQSKMLAWKEAVLINTAASYRSFLAQYPDSDLTFTARTLIERLRFKPNPLPQVAALNTCTTPSAPSAPSQLKKADIAPAIQQTPPVVIKKVAVTPPREIDPPVRTLPPSREVYVDGPVYGYGGPPVRPFPPARLGWGGGFQGGMMGRPTGGFGRRF